MIGSLVGQLLGTAVAARKQLVGPIITKIVLLLVGGILLIAGLAFVLVTIYHALTPWHMTAVQAAGVIAIALLVLIRRVVTGTLSIEADERMTGPLQMSGNHGAAFSPGMMGVLSCSACGFVLPAVRAKRGASTVS